MRLLVSAPVAGIHVLLAKCMSAAINALLQTGLLLGILLASDGVYQALDMVAGPSATHVLREVLPWAGRLQWPGVASLVAACIMSALCCSALGSLCGVFTKTLDGFAVMMNFVIFPVFFFSGALYPVQGMPALARWLSMCNPFTYVVDLLRHVFGVMPEHALMLDVFAVSVAAVALLMGASVKFAQTGAAHWFRL